MSAKALVTVRRRSAPIEFRPHTHHKLHVADDTFDLKYSALLWNQSLIRELKNKSFDKHAERLNAKVLARFDASFDDEDIVNMIAIRSSLSRMDLSFLIDRMMRYTVPSLQHRNAVVINLYPVCVTSAHRLLTDIAFEMSKHTAIQAVLRKELTSTTAETYFEQLRRGNPVKYIHNAMNWLHEDSFVDRSASSSFRTRLVIYLPIIDQYSTSVLSELAQSLSGSESWKCVWLTTASELVTPIVQLDDFANDALAVHTVNTCSPVDVYNSFMLDVLPSNKLPVHLSPTAVRNMHEDFMHLTSCLSTCINRLLAYIEEHFSHRRALVCMSSQLEWLTMMSLMKRSGLRAISASEDEESVKSDTDATSNSKRDVLSRALSTLMSFLDKSDIAGTKLQLSTEDDSGRKLELDTCISSVSNYHDAHAACRIAWQLLNILRDVLLTEEQKQKYHSVLLWAFVLDRNAPTTGSNFPSPLLSFQNALCTQLERQPIQLLRKMGRDLLTHVENTATDRLIQQIESDSLKEFVEKSLLKDVSVLASLGEVIDGLAEDSPELLPLSFQAMKSKVASSSAGVGRLVSVEIPSAQSDQQLGDSAVPGFDQSVTVELSSVDILEELIHDFATCMQALFSTIANIPTEGLEGLSGILQIGADSELSASATTVAGANLRANFMNSLSGDACSRAGGSKSIDKKRKANVGSNLSSSGQSDGSMELSVAQQDIRVFVDRILVAQPLEAAHSWFEQFQIHAAKNPVDMQALNASNNRKRSKADSAFEPRELVQYRFISAIHDLERSGIIGVRNFQEKPAIMKQMYTGLTG